MKVVITAGGSPPSFELLKKEIKSPAILIAVDSGANCLFEHKITPDYLIGDLDSIDKNSLDYFRNKNIAIEQHPRDKDFTDAELALKKAIELGAKEIVFLGCLGGKRIDHTLGALGLLDQCDKLKVNSYLKDDYQTITLLTEPTKIHGESCDHFSLHAFGKTVKNLNISGSKYELQNYDLEFGDARTLSNEFKNQEITIDFSSGKLLLFKFI